MAGRVLTGPVRPAGWGMPCDGVRTLVQSFKPLELRAKFNGAMGGGGLQEVLTDCYAMTRGMTGPGLVGQSRAGRLQGWDNGGVGGTGTAIPFVLLN